VPRDHVAAQHWFRAAADCGHGPAQLMLSRYLATALAGDRDPEEARLWLERAAAQGVAEAEQDIAVSAGYSAGPRFQSVRTASLR
jgi:TPR repeat protein